jgi:hypothetical protein
MVRRFLQSRALYFVALGGNRSSKSWSGAVCGAITAMGAAHPDVVELLRRNGLDRGRLQLDPALVLAGSITNDDSRDYLRPIYDSLLPDAWLWSARFAAQTASTWQPGSGAGLPGSVLFKTTSGADASKRWQGTSTPLVHNDEDHGDVEVLREQVRAVADQGGRWLGTFTPTRGKSPVCVDMLFRDPPRSAGEVEVYKLDPVDNPMIDGDAMRRWLASMTERERRVRRHAEFVQLDGLVHPTYNEAIHVIPAIDAAAMADWPRIDGLDFGFRAPLAYVWGAVDPRGVLHILRVRYEAGVNTDAHIYAVLRSEACAECWPGRELCRLTDGGISALSARKPARPVAVPVAAHRNRTHEQQTQQTQTRAIAGHSSDCRPRLRTKHAVKGSQRSIACSKCETDRQGLSSTIIRVRLRCVASLPSSLGETQTQATGHSSQCTERRKSSGRIMPGVRCAIS